MNKPPLFVLWFKRDLRLRDNRALKLAIEATQAEAGARLLLLYVFEPSLLADPHYDLRHWRFVTESLADLNQQLGKLSPTPTPESPAELPEAAQVVVCQREVVELLADLAQQYTLRGLYAHQETGLRLTYQRDQAVAAFCQQYGMGWHQFRADGTIRKLADRRSWQPRYYATMAAPKQQPDWAALPALCLPAPAGAPWVGPPLPAAWAVPDAAFQAGGEHAAQQCLGSFLAERVVGYVEALPNPLASRTHGSRLSPYLAWGCLSTRQVVQGLARAQQAAQAAGQAARRADLRAFGHRLLARGYFIQQFERNAAMETDNIRPASAALARRTDAAQYVAWRDGRTGYPLVDASMRCLRHTGYLNFRMRCLLISFLTHHLFQDWRVGDHHLARLFTDFEPGIHYSQLQLQASTDYQPVVRIYNPVKQSQEHDPEGTFIREWVPELANCTAAEIHEPWKLSAAAQQRAGVVIGRDYPAPIIDALATGRAARQALHRPREARA